MTEPRDTPRRSLLLSDIMLPAQFFSRVRGPAEGEQRLLLAILEEAVDCYQKHAFAHDLRGARLFHEVKEWMLSVDKEPFSFEHICDVLGIDPDYLREGLGRWRERQSLGPRGRTGSPIGSHGSSVSAREATDRRPESVSRTAGSDRRGCG